MSTADYRHGDGEVQLSAADRWIRSRLQRVIAAVHEHFAAYRLDLAAQVLYDFTWHEFCDWYLELSKPALQSERSSAEAVRGTQRTLLETLETLLRLLHPLVPFITEEIWGEIAPRAGVHGATIMLQPFPQRSPALEDAAAEEELAWVQQFILGIRQIRGEMDIAPGKALPVLLQHASARDRELLALHSHLLERVGRIASVRALADGEAAPPSATALLGDMKLLVPMRGIIDVDAERARLDKLRSKAEADLARSRGKLDNPNFVNNAPAAVVTQEKERVAEFERQIAHLDEQLARLADLAPAG
jgi:valyl-tRNA synthetase